MNLSVAFIGDYPVLICIVNYINIDWKARIFTQRFLDAEIRKVLLSNPFCINYFLSLIMLIFCYML